MSESLRRRSWMAFAWALAVLTPGTATGGEVVFDPDPALRFSAGLQVVERDERAAFNARPDGGTPATAGETNLALATNGAVPFESSRIGPSYGEDKVSNGSHGAGGDDRDDETRPWIAADLDAGGWAGVVLPGVTAVGKVGLGSRFAGRSDGIFTIQATRADMAAVDLESAAAVNALEWIDIGTLFSRTPVEFGRHLVTFEAVEGITAVRIVVSEGGSTITEIEVYAESDFIAPPQPPPPDPPAAATTYTEAVVASGPIHHYRFEETHAEQPAKDEGLAPAGDRPGGFVGGVSAGKDSGYPRLGLAAAFDGTPGTFVELDPPFHAGPSVTVEAWVDLAPGAAPAFLPIAARWDGSYELDVNASTGKANFVTRNSSGEVGIAESLDVLTRGAWHHVVGIFEAGITTVYLDGVRGTTADTSASGTDLADAGTTLRIGSTRDGVYFGWEGLIDEVAFYDRALAPEEIADHMAAAMECVEVLPDRISISGPDRADPGSTVELEAVLEGIDPGGAAEFLWEVIAGTAELDDPASDRVRVTGAGAGEVALRVSANDGICSARVAAEHRLFFLSLDPPADPTPYTETVLLDGPIHYYRFEETHVHQPAKDSVGPPPDGDAPGAFAVGAGAGAESAAPFLGKAASFDGAPGSYVDLGVPFHPGPSVTVEAWAYLDPGAASVFLPIAARWDGSYELDVSAGTGKVNFVTRNLAGEMGLAESLDPLTRGEWHHVVGTFDGGLTKVYVDGVRGTTADTSATGTELGDAGGTLFIGSTRDGQSFLWAGRIDEVAFYDRALPEETVLEHIAAAGETCRELDDAVTIDGPAAASVGATIAYTARMTGVDLGAEAAYAWSLAGGVAILSDKGGGVLELTFTDAGEVTVRVAAGDGRCLDEATAEIRISCSDSGPAFVRGDADGSGKIDLTDAIGILGYLYLGESNRVPDCLDAADADDNGSLEITDPIGILGHLFLGGAPPAAPNSCGPDPTGEDALGCPAFAGCD